MKNNDKNNINNNKSFNKTLGDKSKSVGDNLYLLNQEIKEEK